MGQFTGDTRDEAYAAQMDERVAFDDVRVKVAVVAADDREQPDRSLVANDVSLRGVLEPAVLGDVMAAHQPDGAVAERSSPSTWK